MKEIMLNQNKTISSIDLVEIINAFREKETEKDGRKISPMLHKDFLRKIRKEIDTLESLGIENKDYILSSC